jgi:hypothetical protein
MHTLKKVWVNLLSRRVFAQKLDGAHVRATDFPLHLIL